MELTLDSHIQTKEKERPSVVAPFDPSLIIGYVLVAASTFLYGMTEFFDIDTSNGSDLEFFTVHYLIAIGYVLVMLFHRSYGIRKSWREENIDKTILLLNLFLISAYALNRNFHIFYESETWFCVFLVTSSLNLIIYRYYESIPSWIQGVMQVIMGSSIVLYLYLSLYVASYYVFGIIGIFALGIGMHIFVPVTLLIGSIALLRRTYKTIDTSYYWIVIGAVLTIAYVTLFAVEWKTRVNNIDNLVHRSVIDSSPALPTWVNVAQHLEDDWITRKILKTERVYNVPGNDNAFDLFPVGDTWEEGKKHDPLVFISTLFSKCHLTSGERVQILKAITDERHYTQDRLWNGDNLKTSYVIRDIDLYPAQRLAYSENYLSIRNTSASNWWGDSEEAIYTFQLPEGSAVTSLSLWINGKEEKAVLTSKQKAINAYTTVVGKERRDPSVVQWQEGNTVSVRVFPCTREEERKFKIGVTSPLTVKGDKMVLQNITFKGPSWNNADETIRVRTIDGKNTSLPRNFKPDGKGFDRAEQKYDPNFELEIPFVNGETTSFTFDGNTYTASPFIPSFEKIQIDDLYLDVNASWTKKDIDSLKPFLDRKNIFIAMDDQLIKLTHDNWQSLTSSAAALNFSLFPFHQLKDIDHALVITKGKSISIQLDDLKGSGFASGVESFFDQKKSVRVFSIDGETSAYIKALREFRKLNFTSGTSDALGELLLQERFPLCSESDNQIILHDANMVITKTKALNSNVHNTAPDHIARLFAYNNIMRKVGGSYFHDNFINEDLVHEAAVANVVSPVSSLIVLETKDDYERFGLNEIENSLHNASKQSSGAVPEPHEWALIILFVLLACYLKFKQ